MSQAPDARDWRWPGPEPYLCSTNPAYLQLDAIQAALGSDMLWWASALDSTSLKSMVDHSLCLGIYAVRPAPPSGATGQSVWRLPPQLHPGATLTGAKRQNREKKTG